ncbi:MAG: hypothetical protein A3J94_14375 [Syntrophus sp. RIFOXYC2_FULL_54_9]|nr:MAG: hypothetical protein A3J94_14375 [Syntrophus sp. RIFOXYC2_FULL_54_9]
MTFLSLRAQEYMGTAPACQDKEEELTHLYFIRIESQDEITQIFLDLKKDLPHNNTQLRSRADYSSKKENKWSTANADAARKPVIRTLLYEYIIS